MRRDDPDVYQVGLPPAVPAPPEVVIAALSPLVTEARLRRIQEVVARRKRSVIPVLEGLTDPHNTSAVLRSADAFGLQEVHVLEGPHGFPAAHRVSRGTDKWLDVIRHASSETCAAHLTARGYRLVVAAMGGRLTPEELRDVPRVALVFGNEHAGASEATHSLARETCAIPMVGFVESLNVSVAAAITLYTAAAHRPGDLSADEREHLTARFLMSTVRDSARIVGEYVRGH
jgi:tRNA (guanosine-2'-O-)-methyltransferase